MYRRCHGFSLIELLVALGVVAILATIVYPAYFSHLATARRSDAAGALTGLQAAMERYFTANMTYAGAASEDGSPAPALAYAATVPVGGGKATYTLHIEAPTDACPIATCFRIQAVPTGSQTGDKCGTLTLTSTGQRGISGARAGLSVRDCWRN